MADYKYIIEVDDKTVWEGLYPSTFLEELMRKYPKKKIAIRWVDLTGDILIASV